MKIDYENVKDYLYFLVKKYAPNHSQALDSICEYELIEEESSIKHLLTFFLAYCESHIPAESLVVKATEELLISCYAKNL